jgi:hypothetical protein
MPGAILVYAKHRLVRHPRRCIHCSVVCSVLHTLWVAGLSRVSLCILASKTGSGFIYTCPIGGHADCATGFAGWDKGCVTKVSA